MEDLSHDALFSPATLMLGKIHWALLRADNLMDTRRYTVAKRQGGMAATEWTELGKEIGTDEIHWWVFKKETDIGSLKARTELALQPAQMLKIASEKLGNINPESYTQLLATLSEFAEKYSGEIELLYEYVSWLEARDPMAPKILFSYRVWGSTQISDRWIKIPGDAPRDPDEESARICAEMVLGLRDCMFTTYERVHNEVSYEIYESLDPEQGYEASEISVPAHRVLARAGRRSYAECASYFEEIRESLRNVLIDICKVEEQCELMKSDAFWRDFILKAAKTKKTESQLWDFKETLTI
jgi:hypothetical protein